MSLSADGSVLVVAPSGDAPGTDQVHVYAWDGISWVQRGGLTRGARIDGRIIVSVSGDGHIVVISDAGSQGDATQAGRACVYAWDGARWTRLGSEGLSGFPVLLCAEGAMLPVAVGANSYSAADGASHVRVHEWSGAVWTERGDGVKSDGVGEVTGGRSGVPISMSADGSVLAFWSSGVSAVGSEAEGSVLAVGPSGLHIAGSNMGPVQLQVHEWANGTWRRRIGQLGGAAREMEGVSVSLSADGSILAVAGYDAKYDAKRIIATAGYDGKGTAGYDGKGTAVYDGKGTAGYDGKGTPFGAARVSVNRWDGSSWLQRGDDIDLGGVGENGLSVSLSADGSVLAVAAVAAVAAGMSICPPLCISHPASCLPQVVCLSARPYV
jgi:hypothetical protein